MRKKDKIVQEQEVEIPAHEAWLFEPENKELLEQLKVGLKQKGTVKRDSFQKKIKDKKHHKALNATLHEWNSPEDEDAFKHLGNKKGHDSKTVPK